MAEDEWLRKIECVINEKMKWIICHQCDRAVPVEKAILEEYGCATIASVSNVGIVP